MSVVERPLQIEFVPVTVAEGSGLTVIDLEAVTVQPAADVTVTM